MKARIKAKAQADAGRPSPTSPSACGSSTTRSASAASATSTAAARPRSGFDCSGFVRYVYAHFGVSLAHSSYAQFGLGRRVGRGSLRPGDLVFFDGLGHVGIYIGNGRFIHAPHTGTRVRIETLAGWYSSRFDGARRLRTT